MSLPSRRDILKRATELYMQEQIRKGIITVTPEPEELIEASWFDLARNELMRETQKAEILKYLEETASEVGMRVVDEQLYEKSTDVPILEGRLRQERREKKKLQEKVKDLIRREGELKRTIEAMPPIGPGIPSAVAPPIREPPRKGEMVISRRCYPLFRRLWDQIKRDATTASATRIVSVRTGRGSELIGRSLMEFKRRNSLREERLIDALLSCEILGEES